MVEVLDHAPAEMTPAERLLLVAIAEKANEQTRTCWPGMAILTRRTGLSDRQVRRVLADLARRGYEVRVASGVDKRGMPVFATKGRRTVYRMPDLRQRGSRATALKEDACVRLNDPKADIPGTQRQTYPVAKADARVPPFPQEPSKQPSNPRDRRATANLNTIRDALAKVGCKRLDDDWCRQVVKHAEQNGTVRKDLTGFVVACIEREPERFTPVADYAPRYRKEDH